MKLALLVTCVAVLSIIEAKPETLLQRNKETIHNVGKLQRIVGGSSSFLGEYPWLGLFLVINVTSNRFDPFCGCSLLDDQWAITAAHCTYGFELSSISLAFNLYNTSDYTNAQVRSITEIKGHPSYNPPSFENDISLLKLNETVTMSANVQPIALPTQGVDETVGKNCTISGWGDTSFEGSSSQILLKATVPVLDNQECNNWYNPNISISSKQICAGYREGGVDTCQGDSGGPLACLDENETYILQGITSFGLGCGEARQPGVYTRVSEYVTWINSIRDVPTTTEYMSTTETATTKVVPSTTEHNYDSEISTCKGSLNKCCYTLHLLVAATVVTSFLKSLI